MGEEARGGGVVGGEYGSRTPDQFVIFRLVRLFQPKPVRSFVYFPYDVELAAALLPSSSLPLSPSLFFFSPLFFFFSLVAFFPIEEAAAEFGFLSCSAPARLGSQSHRSSTAHTCLPACPCCFNYLGAGVVRLGSFVVWVHRHSLWQGPPIFVCTLAVFFFPRFWFTCQQLHSFAA